MTEPYDDPKSPTEVVRPYVLGIIFMGGITSLSTFFYPHQHAISIPSNVLQPLQAPCGFFLAKIVPDCSFSIRRARVQLNPGPWSVKEKMLATIMFTIASGPGSVVQCLSCAEPSAMPGSKLGHLWVRGSACFVQQVSWFQICWSRPKIRGLPH